MTIREAIQKRLITEVPIDIPEIPAVRVRRLSLADMLALEETDTSAINATLVQRTILDEQDQPLFADVAAVTSDWKLYQALLKATAQVNDLALKVEQAQKN